MDSSNEGGALSNLLRDHLGHVPDVSGLNHEVARSGGVIAGACTVNLHLHRSIAAHLPVSAHVVASVEVDAGVLTSGSR